MNVGIPPRSLNQRLPAAEDAPTANAASSLLRPLTISRQNDRSSSRRCVGCPGDFIGALPVNSLIHPAGLPINTSTIKMLRGPVESSLLVVIAVTRLASRRTRLVVREARVVAVIWMALGELGAIAAMSPGLPAGLQRPAFGLMVGGAVAGAMALVFTAASLEVEEG
jgi:hypothetical protein